MKGDIWPSYSKQRIEWDAANIDNIKIESSLDSGRTWKVEISSYAASAGFYEWEVPNKTSDSCFIRIFAVEDSTKSASNYPNNPFKIPPPGITIDSIPSSIYKGSVQPLTWVSSGVRKVNIFVSYNNKLSFSKIADTVIANSFYYNWIVPNTTGNQCFIVINDANNNSLADTLKMSFNLIDFPVNNNSKYKGGFFDGHASAANKANILKLLTLNNPDSIYGSSIQNIKWDARNIDLINIYYSANNGSTWSLVGDNISAVAGQYSWKASSIPTNQAKIKIVATADSSIFSISSNAFIIRKKELKFSSIDSSSTFNRGGIFPISWQSGGVNFIKLKLISNTKDSTLKDSIPANFEMHNWIIHPSTVDSFKLVLVDLDDSTVSDTAKNIILKSFVTSNPAKYKGGPYDGHTSKSNSLSSIKLLYPNGGEMLSVQNNTTITWKNNNIEKIKLDISIDSGTTWTTLNADITGTINNFVWKTPNTPSSKCLIRVSDAADASVFDITDSIFSLQPKSLVFTTDSSSFVKETAKSIEWKPQGVDSVRIKYKGKLNDNFQLIQDSIPAKFEFFNWILPATLGDSIWIKIEDIKDTAVNDLKTYFKKTNTLIKDISLTKYRGGKFDGHAQRSNINKLIIRKPEANEVLVGGSKYAITWSTVNLEDSVLIEFTIDSGRTWNTVTRTVASSGRYEWTIPNSIQGNSVNIFEFGTIRSTSTNKSIQNYNSTAPIIINSSKCQIRAVDISAGNVVVGSTSNNFAIVASTQSLKDTISFSPPKTMTLGDPSQTLLADATSKRLVKFFIDSGATKATINSTSLIAKLAGKVRIGAYVEKDSLYVNVDTVYQTICINPVKPIIPYTDKLLLCNTDSALVTGTSGFNQYLWSNGETSNIVKVTSSNNIALKVGVEGCYSTSSDTLKFTKSTTTTPAITAATATSFCIGGSVVLTSSAATGNQWFKDGAIITGATNITYTATQSGNYTVRTTNTSGCESALSTATTVTVNPLPATPTITAATATSFCIGGSVVLTSSAATGNQWFKDGAIITGATNTTYTASQSGNYTVRTTNANGCESTSVNTTVTVNAIPTKATITQTGADLISSSNTGNLWFKDADQIAGATDKSYRPLVSGYYRVQIRLNGCAGPMSDPYFYLVTSVVNTNTSSDSYKLFPNPVKDKFLIDAGISIHKINYQIFDTNGKRMMSNTFSKNIMVDISRLNSGTYTILITNTKTLKQESKQIIKQ